MLQGNLLCGLRVNSTEQLDIQDSFFEFFAVRAGARGTKTS